MVDPLEALYTGQDPETLKVISDNSTKMLTCSQKKQARFNKSANRLNNGGVVV